MPASLAIARWLNRRIRPRYELCCDVLLERSLLDPLPEASSAVELDIRIATHADLDVICAVYASDPYLFLGDPAPDGSVPDAVRKLYAARLDRGELCFIATAGDQVAHVNWTCLSWGEALADRRIHLGANEIYTTDGYTAPAFRGRNVHARVLRAMLAHARGIGRTHAYTMGPWDRPQSFKGLARLGWRERGRVYYLLYSNADRTAVLWRVGRLDPINWRSQLPHEPAR